MIKFIAFFNILAVAGVYGTNMFIPGILAPPYSIPGAPVSQYAIPGAPVSQYAIPGAPVSQYAIPGAPVPQYATSPSITPFVLSETKPLIDNQVVGGPAFNAIPFFSRTIDLGQSQYGLVMINYSIPWFGNNATGSRTRILLEVNGVIMSDASKYCTRQYESYGVNLNAVLNNVPGGQLSIRVLVATDIGSGGVTMSRSYMEYTLKPEIFATLQVVALP